MYREAIVLSIHRSRPGLDVRAVFPEDAEGELAGFRPHLLVHNDTIQVPVAVLAGVPYRVEVLYSDGMDARVHGVAADGEVSEMRDISTEELLGVVDVATTLAAGGR